MGNTGVSLNAAFLPVRVLSHNDSQWHCSILAIY